jgi:hypothetical protein
MRRYGVFVLVLLAAFVLSSGFGFAQESKVLSQTGKVTAVDPQGKAIVIEAGKGKQALTVGAIVDDKTKVAVKGKKIAPSDLGKNVKEGDTVTLRYVRTDDLYARQVIKK